MRKTIVIILAILFMIPVFWTVTSSFKSMSEIYKYPPTIFPKKISFEGYINIFKQSNFMRYLYNTLFVAIVSTVITVFLCVSLGYGLAKGTFKHKDFFSEIVVITLFVTAQIIMVPLFVIIKQLGLMDTLWGLIIPAVFTPTGAFTAIQYMKDLPDEFLESAKVDGANEWQIFMKIVMPLSKPLIASLAIFSFTWRWNDFVLPLIVINSGKNFTIQLALATLQGQYGIPWNEILAFSVMSIIPTLIIFLLFQNLFMKGLSAGGLKY
ncbi:MAG: carbohydrate ABC transporter permease [Defluviitoga tunisiensis]|jgi:alpha-1,4-digalacturonate transport system permease protein|nr:carbohydrate ABC transporter permease [Acholeplasmataceae bacterium]